MAKYMKVICKLSLKVMIYVVTRISKNTFQDYFYSELIELLNDEDLMVRLEAIDSLIDILSTFLTPD